MSKQRIASLVLCCTMLLGSSAAAQTANAQPTAAQIDEARRHYERGLELYNEENFDAALVEMDRAYKIAPTYRILYNLGRIHRQLNDYAASIRDFETYLREGGENIPADRRQEVEKDLTMLRGRVAKLDIRVNVEGADVSVDDVPVGKAPLTKQVVVNPGRRKLTAQKPGYAPATYIATVVGTDTEVVKLNLVDLRPRAEKPVDNGPRNRAIVAWGVTGVFTATAVVLGFLSLNENEKLDQRKAEFPADPDALADQSSKVNTFSLLTDVSIGAAAVSAGVATFFTIKALSASNRGVEVGLGRRGLSLSGSF